MRLAIGEPYAQALFSMSEAVSLPGVPRLLVLRPDV